MMTSGDDSDKHIAHEWSVIDITNLIRHNQMRRKFLATDDLDLPQLPRSPTELNRLTGLV